jgi:hypothetical protein
MVSSRPVVLLLTLIGFAVVGCGDDDDAADTTTSAHEPAGGQVAVPEFQVPFRFELPEGWAQVPAGAPAVSYLVVPPSSTAAEPSEVGFEIPGFADVEDVIAEITSADGYTVSEPTETTLGGHPASVFDISVADGTSGDPPTLYSLAFEETWAVQPGGRARVFVVDVEGDTVTVFYQAPVDGFEAFAEEAEALLSTVMF